MLQERIPRRLVMQDVQGDDVARVPSETEKPAVREIETPHTPQPVVGILGNVPYTTLITNAGGGFSRYGESRGHSLASRLDARQLRPVVLREGLEHRARLVDGAPAVGNGAAVVSRAVRERSHHVHRRDGDIDTVTEIAVAPDDAAEVRRDDADEQIAAGARDRADQLLGSRARAAGRRSCASGVWQSLRSNGISRSERSAACDAAPSLGD